MPKTSKKICSGVPVKINPLHLCKPSNPEVYYHYTSLEKMWLILEGETLRATQACFSNDNEEILKGIEVVKRVCGKIFNEQIPDQDMAEFIQNISIDYIDSYIVCFCRKDNKLSQWRAYCKDGGASLGFDFSDSNLQYYFKKRDGIHQTLETSQLHPVYYLNSGNNIISDCISEQDLAIQFQTQLTNIGDNQTKKHFILSAIPYIKHAGFCEEEEHRLLFDNKMDYSNHNVNFVFDDIVEYADRDGSYKSPYISICFSPNNIKDKNSHTVKQISIFGTDDDYKNISTDINEMIRRYNIYSKEKLKIEEISMTHILSKNRKITIGQADFENQKNIFYLLDQINTIKYSKKYGVTIPIWCEGHLPIRSITVAPSADQNRIISMIKHYCTHGYHYWLKYVDVRGSDIPYRSY